MRFRIFGYQIPSVNVGKLDISVYFFISFKFQRMIHGLSNRDELEFFIEAWYLHTLSKFTWYLYISRMNGKQISIYFNILHISIFRQWPG